MRVAIMENNHSNLMSLISLIHKLLPEAMVTGFTNGNDALHWCEDHASDIDLFLGNWWGSDELVCGPEGANIARLVIWEKQPKIILYAGEEMFRKWSMREGANAFLLRPITTTTLREALETLDIKTIY
ncbi:MAG: hypothetical protein MJ097_04335 [Dorea sp.]|nr:hypothetical protein [Dorea sp.]